MVGSQLAALWNALGLDPVRDAFARVSEHELQREAGHGSPGARQHAQRQAPKAPKEKALRLGAGGCREDALLGPQVGPLKGDLIGAVRKPPMVA